MIVKEKGGYSVKSESGKNLGHYKSQDEARKRLAQVEMFKNLRSKGYLK